MKTKWVRRLACTGATLGLLLGASVPAEAGSDAYYRIKGTISEANDDVGATMFKSSSSTTTSKATSSPFGPTMRYFTSWTCRPMTTKQRLTSSS